jgi:hypothetical protein
MYVSISLSFLLERWLAWMVRQARTPEASYLPLKGLNGTRIMVSSCGLDLSPSFIVFQKTELNSLST